MPDYIKKLVNEAVYGVDCLVLDNGTIDDFLSWRKTLNEESQVQGVYSDEGLYDFYSGFSDYKRISKSNAAKVLGWSVVDYILSDTAEDPFYQMDEFMDDQTGRADTVSYGGTVVTGDKTLNRGDYKWMREMETIIDAIGWQIVDWIGCGPDRKSKVVIIPSKDQTTMSGKVNEDIIMRIQFNETIKKVGDKYAVYPKKGGKRLGTHNSKKKALAQLKAIEISKHEIKEQENNIKKIVAVYPGRFQPFGPHHKETYNFLKKRFDDVYVATSNKQGGNRHPMSFSQKKKHMTKMGIPSKSIVQEKQPYIPKGLLSKYDSESTAVVFAVGAKDEGRLSSGKYFKKYRKNYMRLKGYEEQGYTLQAPHVSVKVGGQEVSGTTMRKLLGSEKYDLKIKKKFFKKMFGYFDQKTFDLFVTSFKESITKKPLISEGGAYGHMAHPFDDYALTFGELKDIIDLGLQGTLDKEEAITEKLDGQNIMISCINGKAVAARNKGDLKRGGMSLKGIQVKFKNHIKTVRDAFVFSMRDISNAVEKMSKKDQLALFNDGKNWANIEIIYPENKNVIDYDGGATIVFHGILKYNEAWIPSGEVRSGGKRIADIINKVNKGIQTKFAFKGPNVIKLHKPKNYGKLRQKYIGSLNKLQNIYRLKDSDELSLYHQHFWLEYILNGGNSTDYQNMPDNVLYSLMKRWAFSDKSYKMTEINKLKDDYPKFVDWVRSTEKMDHANMLKSNMKPFEEIFFGVGAEILSNASNYLSANPEKTAKKLRDDLDKASKSLLAKKDFSNIDKLKAQLKKLKAMPNLSKAAPTEGLVFKYNGKIFKFTGFFAPINQILGLEKFSR
jgi:hypothetical protein